MTSILKRRLFIAPALEDRITKETGLLTPTSAHYSDRRVSAIRPNTDVMTTEEKAAAGVRYLKEAILEYLGAHPDGVPHSQIVTDLGLQSSYEGGQQNYLSFSVLGLLLADQEVRYERRGNKKFYFRC